MVKKERERVATRVRKSVLTQPKGGIGSRYEDYMAGAMHFLDYAHNRLEQQLATMLGEERDKTLEKKKWLEETIRRVERESIVKNRVRVTKKSIQDKRKFAV